ncbi:GNAT family N-acetyltransferase [Hufsiella ginkgonis]|uniref:GNAT family N-acetyltransferase n=1 Tax=Hufsiella ginkgonis TaxID=2695274 RepID=A0A7K1XWH3_9SPHI|nr:GNAT family N-acetyltransferase [Hufsiella ginkgonis]MXV15354.1 GNAT family N-acetyltransferase [Hufsiella ginkgonis]
MLIAVVCGKPIGIVQIIDPLLEDSHYWGDVEPGLRAIDIWIGEADQLNKSYDTQMMQLALARCFAPPGVTAVLIDPLGNNTRAHRFYEPMEFTFLREQVFGKDRCRVYGMERRVDGSTR